MKNKILILFLSFFVFIFLIVARPDTESENYRNADATNHTLLTVRALQSNPISEHCLLPTVTLGNPEKNGTPNFNAFLPWAESTYPDKHGHGNYIYISFPPASFLIPYAYFSLTGLPVTEGNLQILSIALTLLGWFFLTRLGLKLFPGLPGWFVIVTSALTYFFLRETLHSAAAIYWAQTAWQVIFILQLSFFYKLYSNFSTKNIVLFSILCFFSAIVEWTGFVGNAGFFLLLLTQGILKKERRQLYATVGIAVATLAALATILLHFSLLLNFNDILQGMRQRQSARAATAMSATDIFEWFKSYWVSFGIILPLLAIMATVCIKNLKQSLAPIAPFLFVSAFILLENFIVMSHAYLYRYDRIKGIILLILLFLAFSQKIKMNRTQYSRPILASLCSILAIACIWNYSTYKLNQQTARYKWKEDLSVQNRMIADIKFRYTYKNSLLAHAEKFPKIELLYLFNRNIVEGNRKDGEIEQLLESAKKQGRNYVVVLESLKEKNNLGKPTLCSAKVYDVATKTIHESLDTKKFTKDSTK